MKDPISEIENFVRSSLHQAKGSKLLIAHDFEHLNRVRSWALRIAEEEGMDDLLLIEAAALLHDIGLTESDERKGHAELGAEIAAEFLSVNRLFSPKEISTIADAISSHSSLRETGPVGIVLRDADILDLLGAIGVLRAANSYHFKPEYQPGEIKGASWKRSADYFTRRFENGLRPGDSIVDEINFQLSCADNLGTQSARRYAEPLVAFMRSFVLQLEAEVVKSEDLFGAGQLFKKAAAF